MRLTFALTLLTLAIATPSTAQESNARTSVPGPAVLEIRSYNLKKGSRNSFHELFVREALPLLRRSQVDVVAYGPSLHDADSYFLMRAFSSLDNRERVEDAFYSSSEWRNGPRAAVLAAIDSYTTVVIGIDHARLNGLRKGTDASAASSDLEALTRLNDDYIRSTKTSDVKRFDEILADDFLCTFSDGTLVERAAFLKLIAKPSAVANLQAHDVNVRLMGDFAIVHAATTFTLPDGKPGSSRYTDVWAKRSGRWVAVAAQVTRK